MSDCKPAITENGGSFYALIVCIEDDGFERVVYGYKGRHFKSMKAALKSTTNYINKHGL